jgi:hypothetical protein
MVARQHKVAQLAAAKTRYVGPPKFPQPILSFTVLSPIVPGQPLPISWAWSSGFGQIPSGTAFVGNVYINDPVTGESLTLNEAPLTFTVPGTGPGFGVPTQNATLSPPTPRASQLLYAVGSHKIQFNLQIGEGDTSTASATAVVQPDLNWIQFSSPSASPPSPAWNSSYNVSATGTNTSSYANFQIASFEMIETDTNTGQTRTVSTSVTPSLVGASGSGNSQVTVDTASITQNWTWMNPFAYFLQGPTSDTFTYSAWMVLEDQFGNVYPNVSQSYYGGPNFTAINAFDPLRLLVSVSQAKQAAEIGALIQIGLAALFQAVAVALGIAAATAAGTIFGLPAAAVLGAAAGAAQVSAFACQQAAQGFANQATDPPVPDFCTRELLRIVPGAVPGIERVRKQYPQLARTLEIAAFLYSAGRTLDAIDAKLVACFVDKDKRGRVLQIDARRKIARMLEVEKRRIPLQVVRTRKELKSSLQKLGVALNQGVRSLQAEGLSSTFREKLLASGAPVNLVLMVEEMAKDGSLASQMTGDRGTPRLQQFEQYGSWLSEYCTFLTQRARRRDKSDQFVGNLSPPSSVA